MTRVKVYGVSNTSLLFKKDILRATEEQFLTLGALGDLYINRMTKW